MVLAVVVLVVGPAGETRGQDAPDPDPDRPRGGPAAGALPLRRASAAPRPASPAPAAGLRGATSRDDRFDPGAHTPAHPLAGLGAVMPPLVPEAVPGMVDAALDFLPGQPDQPLQPEELLPPGLDDAVPAAIGMLPEGLAGALPLPPRNDAEVDPDAYRTPRAGEPLHTEVFGRDVDLPFRDRRHINAITLGSVFFEPRVGESAVVPFAALYMRRLWAERRLRAVISGLVNDIDYGESIAPSLDFVAHFGNHTIPFATTEVIDGEDLEFTSLESGRTELWVGLGFWQLVAPGEVDNQLRIDLFYKGAYDYFRSSDDTNFINVPPDTYVHGLHARVRLDMIERNILELPHAGFALGADFEFLRRDTWEDTGLFEADGSRQFPERKTRDYMRVTAYAVLAGGVPWLSEKHRLLGQLHWAWAPHDTLDRHSAFRLGGGPQATEYGDLARSPYPAANFDQFPMHYGLIATVEYRYEVLFFLYLHLRLTLAYAKIPTFDGTGGPPNATDFVTELGETYSVAVTSGFLWDSLIHLEVAYDTGSVRAGDDGVTVLVSWSKSF